MNRKNIYESCDSMRTISKIFFEITHTFNHRFENSLIPRTNFNLKAQCRTKFDRKIDNVGTIYLQIQF